jgi:glutamyl-tRNA reductase
VVDLGAPTQVDAAVATRPDVQLFGLDDLLAGDQRVAAEDDLQTARSLVHDAVAEFRVSLRKRELADLLRVAQDGYDRFVADELPALVDEALPPSDDPEVRRARAALEDGLRAAMRRQVRELIETLEGWSARSPRGS